jgi:hypothetical protein
MERWCFESSQVREILPRACGLQTPCTYFRRYEPDEKELPVKCLPIEIAFALIFAFGFTGAALADEAVKSSGNYDKPGRTADEETVKSGGASDKPGRTLEDETVRSGGGDRRPGRAVDEVVKSGGSSDKPGRQMESSN